jgi:hypothetical protein
LLSTIDPRGVATTPAQASFERMMEELKFEPSRDLDVLFGCVVRRASETRFVIAVVGKFPLDSIATIRRHTPELMEVESRSLAGLPALAREGRFLVQASDGVLVFGDDEALVTAALVARAEPYGLPTDGEIAVVGLPAFVGGEPGTAETLPGLERAELVFRFGRSTALLTLAFADEAATRAFDGEAKRWMEQLKGDLDRLAPAMRPVVVPWVDAFERSKFERQERKLTLALELDPGVIEGTLLQALVLGIGRPGRAAGGG